MSVLDGPWKCLYWFEIIEDSSFSCQLLPLIISIYATAELNCDYQLRK